MRTSRTIYQQLLAVLLIDSTIAPLPVARGQPVRASQSISYSANRISEVVQV